VVFTDPESDDGYFIPSLRSATPLIPGEGDKESVPIPTVVEDRRSVPAEMVADRKESQREGVIEVSLTPRVVNPGKRNRRLGNGVPAPTPVTPTVGANPELLLSPGWINP
jgi:hypothetical protein